MKFSFNWLKEFVEIKLPLAKLAEVLNSKSFEAEVSDSTPHSNIYVGEVVNFDKHPNADRLRIVSVSLGDKILEPIVCAASNFSRGDLVAVCLPGGQVRNQHDPSGKTVTLEKATIRGVESVGMLCTEYELGLSEKPSPYIFLLPPKTPVGIPLSGALALKHGDKNFLELDLVTTNRSDIASHRGLAREIAAVTGAKTKFGKDPQPLKLRRAGREISMRIKNPKLCARCVGVLLKNVKVDSSPDWIAKRLDEFGIKTINNVVDITNYVMLEYGNPLHAFDADKIANKSIIIRNAKRGERIKVLDGKTYELDPECGVIADENGPLDIAGVIGGVDSAITKETSNVLLTCATFNNIAVRRTSRKLGIATDAAQRFFKGLPASLAEIASARAVELLTKYANAKVAEAVETGQAIKPRKTVSFNASEVVRLLGIEIKPAEIKRVLRASGFDADIRNDSVLKVYVPDWRTDIVIPEDIVEEVGRLYGYENLPDVPVGNIGQNLTSDAKVIWRDRLRDFFAAAGFDEVCNYSFVSASDLRVLDFFPANAVALKNRQSDDQAFLRPELLTNLLKTAGFNAKYFPEVKNFEIGKIFHLAAKNGPAEEWALSGIETAKGDKGSLFYKAKGVIEALADRYLNESFSFLTAPNLPDFKVYSSLGFFGYHGQKVGVIGIIHPKAAAAYGISDPVVYFNLSLEKIFEHLSPSKTFLKVSKFPRVVYDISMIVGIEKTWAEIVAAIRKIGSQNLTRIEFFDEYRGKSIPVGKRSLSFHLVFQSNERTLREEEVKKSHEDIIKMLRRQFGAEIRKS